MNINDLYIGMRNGTLSTTDDFLAYACCERNTNLIRALLNYGVNPNIRSSVGKTPLMYLCEGEESPDLVDLLLRHGACPFTSNDEGQTALFNAAKSGFTETVRKLLSAGAEPNVADFGDRTPLHEAAERGFVAISKLLIDAGADTTCYDTFGNTPIENATNTVRELFS